MSPIRLSSLLLVVASLCTTSARAEPFEAPQHSTVCPFDGGAFSTKTAPTRFVPAADRHLRHGRMEPLHGCSTCGWIGTADAARRLAHLTPTQIASVRRTLLLAGPTPDRAAAYVLAARINEVAREAAEDRGHLLLMAARAAGDGARTTSLRRAARDAFLEAAPGSWSAAWAAAELSAQAGDTALATHWFERVAHAPDAPPRLRRFAREALRGEPVGR